MTDTLSSDFSQGSHFFQNMTSAGVSYFSVSNNDTGSIDWTWLEQLGEVESGRFIRHVRTPRPLSVMVDGRCNKGLILRHEVSNL
jgi:hypothetical protein